MTSIEYSEIASTRSLWLQLVCGDLLQVFELVQGAERAITVGSLQSADMRLVTRHVAPIGFHFEREGNTVWLIPAYRSALRVNAMHVGGPVRITDRALIEFDGIGLEATVLLERPPGSPDTRIGVAGDATHVLAEQPSVPTITPAKNPVVTAIELPLDRERDIQTVEFEIVGAPRRESHAQKTELVALSQSTRDLEGTKPAPVVQTQRMAAFTSAVESGNANAVGAEQTARPRPHASMATVPTGATSSREQSPTQLETPAAKRSGAAFAASRPTVAQARATVQATQPAWTPWLWALGLLKRNRAIALAVAVLASAVLLALVIIALSNLMGKRANVLGAELSAPLPNRTMGSAPSKTAQREEHHDS